MIHHQVVILIHRKMKSKQTKMVKNNRVRKIIHNRKELVESKNMKDCQNCKENIRLSKIKEKRGNKNCRKNKKRD